MTAGAEREEAEIKTTDDDSVTTDSLLAELAFNGIDGLVVTGGFRYVDHETFGDTTTGRVTASYSMEETGTRFIANWAEGFKSPSIYQLTYICAYCGLTEPTPDLQPEESEAYEFGVEQSLFEDKLVLGATYFHSESSSSVIFDFSAGYQNLGRSQTEGVELTLDAQVSDKVTLKGHYTYSDAIDLETNMVLLRQPEHTAYAAVDLTLSDKAQASLSATYNGEETDFGGHAIKSWTRFDLKLSYDVTDDIQLYGRIDNLLDEEYQHVIGYGTPDRSAFTGVRANF